MKTVLLGLLVSISVITFLVLSGRAGRGAEFPEHPLASKYQQAAEELAKGLREADMSGLAEAIDRAVGHLPANSYIAARLRDIKEKIAAEADKREVLATLNSVVEDLRFRPIAEANLADGFPACTPVGEVEVKKYPVYRAAVTSENGMAFWRLFAHIKKHNVAMTAPVEMTLAENGQQPVLMAFLYERPDQGSAGQDGVVEVRDQPEGWFVSTGVRGPRTTQAVQQARERIEEWLARNGSGWEIAGPPRLMGYNSPFVARNQTYWEYQIPVREKPSAN